MSNSSIHLLHVVDSFDAGGTERQQAELIKRLPRDRYTQVVAAMNKRGPFLPDVEACGAEVIEFPFTSFCNSNALRQMRRLAALIKERDIQIVHCHNFYANIFGSAAAKIAGTAKLVTSRRDLGNTISFAQRCAQRITFAASDAIVANSEMVKHQLMRNERVPGARIHRIYNGIDTEIFAPQERSGKLAQALGIPENATVVGMVGNLNKWKGHRDFLQAAAEVIKERSDVCFLLVGEGPERESLQTFAENHGVADVTVFAGPREDIPNVLALMDVFVLSSPKEGLPNAVIEAMACSLPVVATKAGGTVELIDEGTTGFVVPLRDTATMAEKILALINDPQTAAEMGAAARRKALDEFSTAQLIQNTEAFYAAILQESVKAR
jgi:glycosyltransferase involved in cell wall biosynthesis